MNPWVYACICVLAPAAWGTLMYFVFGRLRRHARDDRETNDVRPGDYVI
jgi:hypothetical protein